ncbi:MAG: hypothetical protein KKC79_00155 [Gammaproteobacteria bacterium]|nr:hypothetical protein [Gammaproteobacteria bacterium]MBU2407042.1 hypothetical protein [Gammaproteobacteria bacterium]
MNATRSTTRKTDLAVVHVLAQLLERLEHSAQPVSAAQYRSVVDHLSEELREVDSNAGLGKLLDGYPAAAELYENLNYQHAGLCRSALDASLSAEMDAKKAIERVMKKSSRKGPDGKD